MRIYTLPFKTKKSERYNGYVVVGPSSPLYGREYWDEVFDKIQVHGGLTCAKKEWDGDGWVFGFDTQHAGDEYLWPDEQSVLDECERLKEQLIALEQEMKR